MQNGDSAFILAVPVSFLIRIDGVVKSPIYFALVICQTFDVQHVLLQAWQITKSCIWALFLSHL